MAKRFRCLSLMLCAGWLLCAVYGCRHEAPKTHAPITAENVKPGISHARSALKKHWKELLKDQENQQLNATPIAHFFALTPPPVGLIHHDVLRHFYGENKWQPVFTDTQGNPNFRALAVAKQAAEAGKHALSPAKYLRPSIANLIQRHDELLAAWTQAPLPTLTEAEGKVIDTLLDESDIHGAPKPLPMIMERLLGDNSPLPELASAWHSRIRLARALAGTNTLLELTLADAWLDWAYDMHDGYWTKVNDKASEKTQIKIRKTMLRSSMQHIAQTNNAEEAADYIASKIPRFVQYQRLLKARQRYKDIVENGGWPEVNAHHHLRRGSQGKIVTTLKERLAIEGYFDGDTENDHYGSALEDAVKSYQTAHQLKVTGQSSAAFWSSLNVPAAHRLAQINLTLQRWRESRIGDSDYYVLINIPDFHASVWDHNERKMRFEIVVGSSRRECKNGKKVFVNATPRLTAEMRYIILNPTWTVPQRIAEDEILPKYLEDPEYFDAHNYEAITTPNGYTMIRQKPGPNNALGVVKFMFPNVHHVYLHDTPQKGYFNYPTRAFSHGCMRVQDPLAFLRFLMDHDDNWGPKTVQKVLDKGETTRVNLNTPVPVFAEYYVVRVDDEGRANFLADLYRLDRARLDLNYVREPDCTPPPKNDPKLKLAADGEVLARDQEGEWVNAREDDKAVDQLPFPQLIQSGGGQTGANPNDDVDETLPSAPPGLPIDLGP